MKRIALILVALLTFSACGVSIKEQAVKGIESAHTSAVNAQQTEISLYATGTISALTADRHRAFHAALAQYFTAAAKLDTAMMAWRAGDPPPSDLAGALKDVQDALAAVQPLAPSGLQPLVDTIQNAVTGLRGVVTLLQPR